MRKILGLILALTLQTVPHPSSFFLMSISARQNFTFLKQRGFWAFPVTSIGILSPTAFAAAMPVMQTLLNFPLEQFSDLNRHVFLSFISRIVQTRQRYRFPYVIVGQ